MFILDSLMISGIQWALKTVVTAAEAELNDDTALREQLLESEMRREMGEISDDEFAELEAELLARIREIKERREGSGPLALGAPMEMSPDSRFQVEASVSGDFHDPADAPHTTVIDASPDVTQQTSVIDIEPGEATTEPATGLPLSVARASRRRLAAKAGGHQTAPGSGRKKTAGAVASGSSRETGTRVPAVTRHDRPRRPRSSK